MVPLDESDQAQRALVYARIVTRATGGPLLLVRASGVESEAGYNKLSNIARRLQDEGLTAEWQVVEGEDAVSAVRETAKAWRPDLIIMTTVNRTQMDRWLHGGAAEEVIASASTPVAVVPPDWIRPFAQRTAPRLLVALDGSRESEFGLDFAIHFASVLPADLVLLRVVHDTDSPWHGAEAYVRDACTRAQALLPGRSVTPNVTTGSASGAILRMSSELEADAIVMTTRGGSGPGALLGRTVTSTLERSAVPLIVLGPRVLGSDTHRRLTLGALMRTLDQERVGEVHGMVVDIEQQALVAVIMFASDDLGRQVIVPIDFLEQVDDEEVLLRVSSDELAELPLASVYHQRSVGPEKREIVAGARVQALDDELGAVTSIEFDPLTARVRAFWARSDGLLGQELRIPGQWLHDIDQDGNIRLAGARADVQAYLGRDRRRVLP